MHTRAMKALQPLVDENERRCSLINLDGTPGVSFEELLLKRQATIQSSNHVLFPLIDHMLLFTLSRMRILLNCQINFFENFGTYAHAPDPHQPVTIGFITRETAGV